MNVRNQIKTEIIAATVSMLQPYVPEISPTGLIAALKSYNAAPQFKQSAKPLTRQETAALLSVSLNTVDRYLNKGLLKKIKISERLVRIDPQSVTDMLSMPPEEAVMV